MNKQFVTERTALSFRFIVSGEDEQPTAVRRIMIHYSAPELNELT